MFCLLASKYALYIIYKLEYLCGGSRNFKTRGRGRIFGSGICFDAPSHIPYVCLMRLVDKKHIVNIVCLSTTIKVYVCYTIKIQKNKPQKSFKQGGAPVLDPPLYGCEERTTTLHRSLIHSDHLAFFRRTLGTRLGSKYKPYWNYI